MVNRDITGWITLGTKLKIPIFTIYLLHNLQSTVLVFQDLCNRDTVPKRTYQNFRDERLFRPGSKYPNWQRSQPISGKVKRRDSIYLVDVKYNITYQNIPGGNSGQTDFYSMKHLKWQKSYLATYMDELYTKL